MKSCLEKMDARILFLEGCWNLKKYLNSGFVILCDIHNLWFIIYEEMIDSIGKRRCWDIILNGNINISILDFLFSIIYIYIKLDMKWNNIGETNIWILFLQFRILFLFSASMIHSLEEENERKKFSRNWSWSYFSLIFIKETRSFSFIWQITRTITVPARQ